MFVVGCEFGWIVSGLDQVPQTKREIAHELCKLEHEISSMGRKMYKTENLEGTFQVSKAPGTPKPERPGIRLYAKEDEEFSRQLHGMETGLNTYGKAHVGKKGRSEMENGVGGLTGLSRAWA